MIEAAVALGAMPLAAFGSEAATAAILPGVAAGRTVLTAGRDRMLRFWDLGTGRTTRAVQLQGKTGPGFGATLSPDGKTLLAHVYQQIVFWDVDSGKELKTIPAPKLLLTKAMTSSR